MEHNITINQQLKELIPPLSQDEYLLLEASVVAEGCRDPIVVADFGDGGLTLIDGHNRFEICKKHGMQFGVKKIDFDSIYNARVWMRNNQMGRRNLTPAWRVELALGNKEDLLEIGKSRRSESKIGNDNAASQKTKLSNNDNDVLEPPTTPAPIITESDSDDLEYWPIQTKAIQEPVITQAPAPTPKPTPTPAPKHNTQAEVAKSAGVSTGTIGMAEKVKSKAPELWSKAKKGDISITAAYKQVQKTERADHREKIKSVDAPASPKSVSKKDPEPVTIVGGHILIYGDNTDPNIINQLPQNAALAFCDPPYNATGQDWDGEHHWSQDYIMDHVSIVAVTPGISSIHDFMKKTNMPYRWSTSCFISNGMTRGALGFGNWIYTAIFSNQKSLHRNAQDIFQIAISSSDKYESHELGAKRQKPPAYLAWIFDLLTNKGDTVIDIFAGSGTSVIVCDRLGLKCVAVERDWETYKAMVSRVQFVLEGK